MNNVTLICPVCGITQILSFENNKQLVSYNNEWILSDQCEICKLSEKFEEYAGNSLLSIDCIDKGKYLFTIDDYTKKLNKNIGYSPRIDRKCEESIYFNLDRINVLNTYLLLSSYLEASYFSIMETYRNIKRECRVIGKLGDIQQKFPNVSDIDFPKYREITSIGKDNFIDYISYPIKHIVPKTTISRLSVIAIMMFIFLKDSSAIIFSCPRLKEKKLNCKNIMLKLLNVKYRNKIIKKIFKDLETEGIIQFKSDYEKNRVIKQSNIKSQSNKKIRRK